MSNEMTFRRLPFSKCTNDQPRLFPLFLYAVLTNFDSALLTFVSKAKKSSKELLVGNRHSQVLSTSIQCPCWPWYLIKSELKRSHVCDPEVPGHCLGAAFAQGGGSERTVQRSQLLVPLLRLYQGHADPYQLSDLLQVR